MAGIEPQWLEELGAHLLKRHRADPHWEKSRAQVVALERGTLYGLPVYEETVTLVREPWTVPERLDFGADSLVPLRAGETLPWKLT